jgi:hypothetical protein
MVSSITGVQFPLNFLHNEVRMCYCRPQIPELCRIFKGSVSYHYVMILTYILVTDSDMYLLSSVFTFRPTTLLA